MAELTKAELIAELAQQKEANRVLQGKQEDLVRRGEGWLVQTPDPAFRGERYGISIVDGQAFVLKSRRVAAFEKKPMTKGALVKYINTQFPTPIYTAEERTKATEDILAREKVVSAERAAEAFEKDLGYKVTWFGVDELMKLDALMQARVTESAQVQALKAARTQAEMISSQR